MTNISVTYTPRSCEVHGKPTLLLSGAIHYPRSTPGMWPKLMQLSKDAGLNAIETYIFWNLHEKVRGTYDFSGRLNIKQFLDLAKEQGLYVILRFGPYICAETSYGGFPLWLRDIPSMQMRTINTPFQQEMERWIRYIADYLQEYSAANGGPVILAQIENEYNLVKEQYGAAGQEYLEWSYRLAQSLNWNIPWFMCYGGANAALETINTFMGHALYDDHRKRHPDQPALWTENWTGWYDVWNTKHLVRTPENEAYAVVRFFAAGGAGVNHYMWHGGTNFDRDGMYLQTTSYDYDAPIDEFGIPTLKYYHLADAHHALSSIEHLLLSQQSPIIRRHGPNQISFTYGTGTESATFSCNDSPHQTHAMKILGALVSMPPQSVIIAHAGSVIFNSAKVPPAMVPEYSQITIAELQNWLVWKEPFPSERTNTVEADVPTEQLALTGDASDYCWYTFTLENSTSEPVKGELRLAGFGDSCACYIDEVYASSYISPMIEEQGKFDADRMQAHISLTLAPGIHRISIFSVSLGLIKGDWMIGHQNMKLERKGIWGNVTFNNEPVTGPFAMHPCLVGEQLQAWAGHSDMQWLDYPIQPSATTIGQAPQTEIQRIVHPSEPVQPRWFQTTFTYTPSEHGIFLNIPGPMKGMAWINGQCIGRVYSLPVEHMKNNAPMEPLQYEIWTPYLQQEYHIPHDWLREGQNMVTIFTETGHLVHNMTISEWANVIATDDE